MRTGKQRLYVALAVCLALVMLVGGLPACKPKAEGELVLGALFPLTGSLAIQGKSTSTGCQIAVDMVNEKGGVLGKKVVLEIVDAPDPAAATSQAERLINEKRVPIIFGSYGSSISIAGSAVAERYKVIWADTGTMSVDLLNRGHKYTFRTSPDTDAVGFTLAEYTAGTIASKIGMQPSNIKLAIIHEDSAFGTSVANAAERRSKALGMQVVLRVPYSSKANDLSDLVLKLKAVAPDVVVATQYLNDEILWFKQAKEQGLTFKAFVGSGGTVGMPDFHSAVGNLTEGVLEVDGPAADLDATKLAKDTQALLKDFLTRYQAVYPGKQPPSPAMNAFVATYLVLTEVLPKAGKIDPDAIRSAYLSLDADLGHTITGFGLRFAANGQNERIFMIVRQWQGDKYTAVYPENWKASDLCCLPLENWR